MKTKRFAIRMKCDIYAIFKSIAFDEGITMKHLFELMFESWIENYRGGKECAGDKDIATHCMIQEYFESKDE